MNDLKIWWIMDDWWMGGWVTGLTHRLSNSIIICMKEQIMKSLIYYDLIPVNISNQWVFKPFDSCAILAKSWNL